MTHHFKILQIIPADHWWAVYAMDDGSYRRWRFPAFALVDDRESLSDDRRVRLSNDEVYRDVRIVEENDGNGVFDVAGSDNLLGVVHDDEWTEAEASFAARAREHVERRQHERERRRAAAATKA